MYKTQFARWGFQKNLTKERVKNLLEAGTVKGARKVIERSRINKYLKRKRASIDTEDMLTPLTPLSIIERSSCDEMPSVAPDVLVNTREDDSPPSIDQPSGPSPVIAPPIPRRASKRPKASSRHVPTSCEYEIKGARKFRILIMDR